ncbi:MAG: GNAT family N-acetyltransferase [Desulfovibrio sp.]
MLIRKYVESDCQVILDIWMEASRSGHPFFDELELQRQRELVATVYLPAAEIWVAEEHGELLGFVGMMDSLVGGLFVAPKHQNKGVGRRLLESMAEKRRPLSVEVFVGNRRARSLYERCGFEFYERGWNDDVFPPQEILILRQRG